MRSRALPFALLLSLVPLVALGCGSDDGPAEGAKTPDSQQPGPDGQPSLPDSVPGVPVAPKPSPQQAAETAALQKEIAATKELTAESILAAHPVAHTTLSYDPQSAVGFTTIQGSPLALAGDELAKLSSNGFVLSEQHRYPSFVYGYASIYLSDLPVYISADSILFGVHKGYDDTLKRFETSELIPEISTLLKDTHARLLATQGALPTQVAADLDLFLRMGLSLLEGKRPEAPAGGPADLAALQSLYDKAAAGSGAEQIDLFGVKRKYDFSQFTPRGHYTDSPALEQYFRAMIWFGRTDLRLIETLEDGGQVLRRPQVLAAVALRNLMDEASLARFDSIDGTIGAFVGENDSMTLRGLDSWLATLGEGTHDVAFVDALDDETIASSLVAGGFGAQRIASQIIINGTDKTLPLSSIFQLFGQRYTVDSHVFSNVVYDRAGGGSIPRMMPNPLDAAFAALGNDDALPLLKPELDKYAYAPDLGAMRVLVDAHEQSYWDGSLGGMWMSSLRALSPNHPANGAGLPTAMRTEAWGRRILNTQLASWAELRHDTILYTKQSYTGGVGCEFPDAYVDPYPEAFAHLSALAARGKTLAEAAKNADLRASAGAYFGRVETITDRLAGMAQKERDGIAFDEGDLAFVNQAVTLESICGADMASGWYAQLFPDNETATEFDPTIADVHTQPTDEGGNPVGKVLHVATGMPRLMVTTVETCHGPRAYAGVVSSYFEKTTEEYKRLTDEEWQTELQAGTPADVSWMTPLVSR
jgi:hypothetical protein